MLGRDLPTTVPKAPSIHRGFSYWLMKVGNKKNVTAPFENDSELFFRAFASSCTL
jgi:hypothetical protein